MMPSEAVSTLYLLIEGRAVFSTGRESKVRQGLLLSGHVFDIWLLSIFGIYLGFEKPPGLAGFAAVAETDCLLFCWKLDVLNKMAVEMSPAVSQAWRNFTLCQLGLDMSWRTFASAISSSNDNNSTMYSPSVCSTGEEEGPDHTTGGRSRDFTDPLRKYEQPHHFSVKHFLRWIHHSISPFMPRGIRHTNQPISGILGRNRIVAYKSAQAQIVYIRRREHEREMSPKYSAALTSMPSSTSQRDALRHATRLLTAELSWRRLEEVSVSDLLMNESGEDGVSVYGEGPSTIGP